MNSLMKIALAIVAMIAVTACSGSKPSEPKKMQVTGLSLFDENDESNLDPQNTSLVVRSSSGAAIAGAKVLIGNALNSPFAGNLLTTDAQGRVLIPKGWTGTESITVEASGFVRTTYLEQMPIAQTITINPLQNATVELKGTATGITTVDRDDKADFAMLFEGLGRKDIFNFSMGRLISPEIDVVSAAGQKIEIPSNISVPRQKENYIIGVTLEKPIYRTYFGFPGDKTVSAVRGQFPFKKFVDEYRKGKAFYDLINLFDIQSGSIRELNIASNTNLDIAVNELAFSQTRPLQAPALAADDYALAVVASPYKNILVPSDLKILESQKSVNVKMPANAQAQMIYILMKRSDIEGTTGRLSAAVAPFNGTTPQLLPPMAAPVVTAFNRFAITPVSTSLTALATYAVLTDVTSKTVNNLIIESASPVWEVYGPQWVSQVELPEMALGAFKGQKRWEVSLLAGSTSPARLQMGPQVLQLATHGTKNQSKF